MLITSPNFGSGDKSQQIWVGSGRQKKQHHIWRAKDQKNVLGKGNFRWEKHRCGRNNRARFGRQKNKIYDLSNKIIREQYSID